METTSFIQSSKEENNDKWASSSKISINSNNSVYGQNPTFQLYLKQKREYKNKRPVIESTKHQRLSFYRAYATSTYKTEILCQHSSQFNWYLWLYTLNIIFKSLPHTFVHIFLAAYSPEQHIFLTKMVPFCVGFKFLLIAASIFEVITYIDTLRLMFHYFISGLLFHNPWNRCANATYYDADLNETVHCYEWDDFLKSFGNVSIGNQFSGHTYKTPNNVSFQVAPIEYFRLNIGPNVFWRDFAYSVVIWVLVSFLTCYVYKKYFWKILHYCHISVLFIDLCTFLYVMSQHDSTPNRVKLIHTDRSLGISKLWVADIDMLAESTTAPPVAHILTSRSTQPIKPSKDSTLIVLSNAVLYLFKGLLTKNITAYCENLLGAPIYYSGLNEHRFFFIRPIFYSSFYLGDLYILGFLGLNFFTEILTVTIVLFCVINSIIYEWPRLRPWMIHVAIFVFAIVLYTATVYQSRLILYVYAKGFAILSEAVFLYILYPLQRLIDDYKFHYGVSLPVLRKMSLQLVPFYYMLKFIIMMDALFEILGSSVPDVNALHYKWSWCLTLIPLLLGMLLMTYRYIFIQGGSWNLIFRPDPNWGPREIYLRELRKQYDSRHYIKSAVSRQLSRYFISKAEFKVYKIDVRYDFYRKYTTIPKEIRFKDDKKDT